MIRNKLKGLIRKAAIKVLNMEFDTQDRKEQDHTSTEYDESKIPKVVDGSGDTPGPNHKEDIGRTWVSAQLAGGVAPILIDIRPPNEVVAGMLPSALLMSGTYLKKNLEQLPEKDLRITIYDQTGDLGSRELAQWLREQGWLLARRLQGGYAEWIEHDERTELPPKAPKAQYQIGDPILWREQHGYVHKVLTGQDKICYEIWVEGQGVLEEQIEGNTL